MKSTPLDDIDEAAHKTAHYLYDIKGDVDEETYQAIGMLRQLINEEFVAKNKSVSSQFLYDQIKAMITDKQIEALNNLWQNHTERIVAWDSEESLRQSWLHDIVQKEVNHLTSTGDKA